MRRERGTLREGFTVSSTANVLVSNPINAYL